MEINGSTKTIVGPLGSNTSGWANMGFRFDDYVFQQISEKYLGGRLGFDVGCIYA